MPHGLCKVQPGTGSFPPFLMQSPACQPHRQTWYTLAGKAEQWGVIPKGLLKVLNRKQRPGVGKLWCSVKLCYEGLLITSWLQGFIWYNEDKCGQIYKSNHNWSGILVLKDLVWGGGICIGFRCLMLYVVMQRNPLHFWCRWLRGKTRSTDSWYVVVH